MEVATAAQCQASCLPVKSEARPYTPLLFPSTCVTSAVSPRSSCHLLRETNKIPYRTDFKGLLDRSKDITTCSQWDGPGNKDTCHQVWRPELNPCNPHGRKRNQILKLSSDLHIQAIAYTWPLPLQCHLWGKKKKNVNKSGTCYSQLQMLAEIVQNLVMRM